MTDGVSGTSRPATEMRPSPVSRFLYRESSLQQLLIDQCEEGDESICAVSLVTEFGRTHWHRDLDCCGTRSRVHRGDRPRDDRRVGTQESMLAAEATSHSPTSGRDGCSNPESQDFIPKKRPIWHCCGTSQTFRVSKLPLAPDSSKAGIHKPRTLAL